MKNSRWLSASVWAVAALVLSGCSASDSGPKKTSAGEGTNTGNGSCLPPPWCLFPRVLSDSDGAEYAGVLNIYSNGGPTLGFTGDNVVDTSAGCRVTSNSGIHSFTVLLELVAREANGTMRFRARKSANNPEADLVLSPGLDLSGTITRQVTKDTNGAPVPVGDAAVPADAETWTITSSVQGKTSVSCSAGESTIPIPLDKSGTMFTQLACVEQPFPPGYMECNDMPDPSQ